MITQAAMIAATSVKRRDLNPTPDLDGAMKGCRGRTPAGGVRHHRLRRLSADPYRAMVGPVRP